MPASSFPELLQVGSLGVERLIVTREDNPKDTLSLSLLRRHTLQLVHSVHQSGPCGAEGRKDGRNSTRAARDVVRSVVGVDDGKAVLLSLGGVADVDLVLAGVRDVRIAKRQGYSRVELTLGMNLGGRI